MRAPISSSLSAVGVGVLLHAARSAVHAIEAMDTTMERGW